MDDASILARDHWAVVIEAGELLGYCCFGAPTRVAGAKRSLALSMSATGWRHGHRFVAAVLDFAIEPDDQKQFRLYALEWNMRSRHAAERHGFSLDSVFESGEGRFVVMVREAHY